jgi:hypothetical protein
MSIVRKIMLHKSNLKKFEMKLEEIQRSLDSNGSLTN